MSASLKPLTLDEFVACERTQPVRYEFDGTQPVAMTGGTIAADWVARRLLRALDRRLRPPCEAFGENVKVLPAGRVRYPDVKVACGEFDPAADHVDPVVVSEVLSPTTEMTDRRVKSAEYASIPSVMAYVLLAQERLAATVLAAPWGGSRRRLRGTEPFWSCRRYVSPSGLPNCTRTPVGPDASAQSNGPAR